jgi:hypothetical protein
MPTAVALLLATALAAAGPLRTQAARGDDAMALKIESSAFSTGAEIPRRYTGEGDDLSPPLTWSGVPPNTKSVAL